MIACPNGATIGFIDCDVKEVPEKLVVSVLCLPLRLFIDCNLIVESLYDYV